MADEAQNEFAELLLIPLRHRFKVFFTFVLCIVAALAVTAYSGRKYRSESKLFVRLGRENTGLDPASTFGQGTVVAVPLQREEEINSVVLVLKSQSLFEQLVDEFGPEVLLGNVPYAPPSVDGSISSAVAPVPQQAALPAAMTSALAAVTSWAEEMKFVVPKTPRDKALELLDQKLDVSAEKKSNVILVEFQAHDPRLAAAVVDRLVELHKELHVRLNRTPGTHDFLAMQTSKLRYSLTELEERLRDMKNATGLVSPADQRRVLVERMGNLRKEMLLNEADIVATQAEISKLETELASIPEMQVTETVTGHPNVAADGMYQQLYSLQLKEQELLSKYNEDMFLVQEVRRQIKEAQELLAKQEPRRTQERTSVDQGHQAVDVALLQKRPLLDAHLAKSKTLAEQWEQAQQELELLNEHETQISAMEREVALSEANYQRYSQSLEQARMDQDLEQRQITNIGVVHAATHPQRPFRPSTTFNLAIGGCLGIILGFGLAFLSERMDDSVKSPNDVVREMDIPNLVAIPQLEESAIHLQGVEESHDVPKTG